MEIRKGFNVSVELKEKGGRDLMEELVLGGHAYLVVEEVWDALDALNALVGEREDEDEDELGDDAGHSWEVDEEG